MERKLFYNTVTPTLLSVLNTLMAAKEFDSFRLVGGTALSLVRGHRESEDIDLFTDAPYGSINFEAISSFLRSTYNYVDTMKYKAVGMGRSYFVGKNKMDCVKLDIFYDEKFIYALELIDGIRLATAEEIIAMKMDVISRGGRKKDFWDIHELKGDYSIKKMLALHEKRYPYSHNEEEIRNNFSVFTTADKDFKPACLRGKEWETVKRDMIDFSKE